LGCWEPNNETFTLYENGRKEGYYPKPKTEEDRLIQLQCIESFPFYCAFIKGRILEDFHKEWIDLWLKNYSYAIFAPRESGKSTILTIDYCEWRLLRDPQTRILVLSNTDPLAVALVSEIKGTYEDNRTFFKYFGNWRGRRKWAEQNMDVRWAIRRKENSIICVGAFGKKATGLHVDIIIFDDLVDYINSLTEGQRRKMHEWVFRTVWPTKKHITRSRPTEMRVVGTRYNPADLYHDFIKPAGAFHSKYSRYKALIGDEDPYECRSFWPEFFPLRARKAVPSLGITEVEEGLLDKYETMGKANFFSQYQNDTEAMKGDLIEARWLENYWSEHGRYPFGLPDKFYLMEGVDLAISKDDTRAFFAWCRILIDNATSNVYVLEVIRERLTFDEQFQLIVRKWLEGFRGVRAGTVFVEAHGYEAALSNKIIEKTVVPCEPITQEPGRIFRRTIELQPLAQNGKLWLHETQENQVRLRSELLEAPNGFPYDCVDALYNATRGVYKHMESIVWTPQDVLPIGSRVFVKGENFPSISRLDNFDAPQILK